MQGRRMNATDARRTVPLFQHAIRCCAPRCGVLVSAADAVAVHGAYVAHMDTHHHQTQSGRTA